MVPKKNIPIVAKAQYIIGYTRYLLIFPFINDVIIANLRFWFYDHDQNTFGEAYHRWVYYVGGLDLVILSYFLLALPYGLFIDHTGPYQPLIPVLSLLTLISIWSALCYYEDHPK